MQNYKTIGVGERQPVQEYAVHNRKNCGVGADAKRKGQQCYQGEAGRATQQANAITEILKKSFPEVNAPRFTTLVLDGFSSAKLKLCLPAGFFGRHPRSD